MEIRVDALRRRPADAGAALRASSLGATGSQAGTRRELRCRDCGFGAVLLWNVFGLVDAAIDLIRARKPIEAGTLREPVA